MPTHNFAPLRGRVVEIEVSSKALEGNVLGDPTTRRVGVYLPPGYEDGNDDYPLFVDLVGFTGSGLSHLGFKAFDESVPQRIERLMAAEKMGPVIAAFPDCFTTLGGNQYINSSAMGNWEDFLIDDMIPTLEEKFRVRKGREHRAVFGKSSGGYGAIAHGLRRADAWNAVACHSGDMMFEWVYLADFPNVLTALAKFDMDPAKFIDDLHEAKKVEGKQFHVLMQLAMAATYDPDPSKRYGVQLPVDTHTCEVIEERWAQWLAHDPVRMVQRTECQENLGKLAGLYIDCGTKDQYHLVYGARLFVKRLKEAGIPHTYEEFPDNHSGINYRMDRSFPFMFDAVT